MGTGVVVAEFIRARAGDIVTAWEREAALLPGAERLGRPALLDSIAAVVDDLARSVEASDGRPPFTAAEPTVDAHVLQRVEIGAPIVQVLAEFGLLRDIVIRLWGASDQRLDLRVVRLINAAVDHLVAVSTDRYVRFRMRALELTDQLATAAQADQMERLLQELLRVFVENVEGVDTASILLREGDALRLRASMGLGTEEDAQRHVTRLGEGFAGLVAAEGKPRLLHSATDSLVKRPALRRSGVQALYGVPLIVHGEAGADVIGVANMGSTFARDFSDEAKALFRILANRAAVAIQQALLRDKLELERTRFRAILDYAPSVIFLKDLEGRYLVMSAHALSAVGIPPNRFIGRTDDELFSPEVARALRATDRKVIEKRAPIEAEDVFAGEDGRRIFLTVKFPVSDRAGRLYAIGGVSNEITDRKRREERDRLLARAGAALASSLDYEETLTTVANLLVPAMADWCIVDMADEQGHVRRLRVVHADPSKAALARSFRELALDPRRPHLLQAAMNAQEPVLMREVLPEYLDTIAQGPDDRRILAELSPRSMIQVPLVTRGRLLGLLGLISSDPNRRYDEEDLAFAEDLCARASLAVDNARLYGLATQAIRAREDVMRIVAHDLRNPLTALKIGVAALLRAQEAGTTAQDRWKLQSLSRSAERMERLISDLIDRVTLQAGQFRVQPERWPARQVLLEAVDAQRSVVAAASVELSVEAPEDLPEVLVDRNRIQQVFANLLGNAAKYTAAGGRVTIGAAASGTQVRFWVSDTGRGMTAEHLERMFDPFWRLEPSRGMGGLGIGLSIARDIVEAHGGRIWAESTLGKGTTVSFTLNVAPPEATAPEQPGTTPG